MTACFHLGSRCGTAKKSGNWFGCSTLLFRDQYGNWTTDVIFWESEDAWKQSEVEIAEEGTPVYVTRDVSGKRLASLTIHDTFEPLNLPPA